MADRHSNSRHNFTSINRRHVLRGTALVGAVSVAGCVGLLGDSDDDVDVDYGDFDEEESEYGDPIAVIKNAVEASNAGNVEEANSYVHSEGSVSVREEDAGGDASLIEMEITDSDESSVTVVTTEEGEVDGETMTAEVTYTLRPEDGEWRIYDLDFELLDTETVDGDDGTGDADPPEELEDIEYDEDVVYEYGDPRDVLFIRWEGMNENDLDKYESVIHPDSFEAGADQDYVDDRSRDVDRLVDGPVIVEASKDHVILETQWVFEDPVDGEISYYPREYELRPHDGQWKYYTEKD